jgi:phytoene synthase
VNISVEQAYRACERIARREAKNFYYAFLVLPRRKRAAMCAVYAFMRHADDLSDDDAIPLAERRQRMQAWLEEWHCAAEGGATEDPVFIALRDVQKRFDISKVLLDQLVQGTMMDLVAQPERVAGEYATQSEMALDAPVEHAFTIYRTFDELYRYCYYVASVVGLVCIRIFGYNDPRAEKQAEGLGIAFQLTNILRDVREDLERGRIYLPLEDMRRYDLTIEQLAAIRGDRPLTLNARSLLEKEARRALDYYAAADTLLPLVAPDSRPALWVLIAVYRRLLEHIMANEYQVFAAKIKVTTWEKIAILAHGFWMTLRMRLFRRAS